MGRYPQQALNVTYSEFRFTKMVGTQSLTLEQTHPVALTTSAETLLPCAIEADYRTLGSEMSLYDLGVDLFGVRVGSNSLYLIEFYAYVTA